MQNTETLIHYGPPRIYLVQVFSFCLSKHSE